LLITTLLALSSVHINAQYGEQYGGEKDVGKEEVKEDGGGGGGYGDGFGKAKAVFPVKEVVIKPAAIQPKIIPYVQPVFKSYQKFAGGYGGYGGHGVYGGHGGGLGGHGLGGGFGGHGGYGGGYGGVGGYKGGFASYGGKLIPINKLPDFQPKVDLTQFIRPYEGAHLLQKHVKPAVIIKHAPPVYIKQPPIEKTIYQNVYVKQPVVIHKQPVIHKEKEITIKKKPAIVEFDEKAPVNVKDFGQTAVVKDVGVGVGVKEVPKEGGYGGGVGGGGYGGDKLE